MFGFQNEVSNLFTIYGAKLLIPVVIIAVVIGIMENGNDKDK